MGQKVYDAVVTRLIAPFYPACIKDVTTVSGRFDRAAIPGQGRASARAGLDRTLPSQR